MLTLENINVTVLIPTLRRRVSEMSQASEQDIREDLIGPHLKSLGWSKGGNRIHREKGPSGTPEAKARVKADYLLYLEGYADCSVVVEAKAPGKSLRAAMEQAQGYVGRIREKGGSCCIAIATDGTAVHAEWWDGSELEINGEAVRQIPGPRVIQQFAEAGKPYLVRGSAPRTSQELVTVFKQASKVLHKEGLINLDAFIEFSQILFVKVLTELADLDPARTAPKLRWQELTGLTGEKLLSVYKQNLKVLDDQYPGTFSTTSIRKGETIQAIVAKLDGISFVDAEADVKGEAYEYFLREYNKGQSALGQHFTPRHVINAMVGLLGPKFRERVYDPFCGTGGMLIAVFKEMERQSRNEVGTPPGKIQKILQEDSIFGNEITKASQTARMNLILAGDGNSGLEQRDSLERTDHVGEYDIVIANIPFTQEEVKYVEHCMDAVKQEEGGRLAVIVPERFLDRRHPEYGRLRQRLLKEWTIRRIISLPREVFRGITAAKTSVIYAVRRNRGNVQTEVPYFVVDNDGLTKNKRRERIQGRNDLDKLLEERDEDETCAKVEPKPENGWALKPKAPEITVPGKGKTTSLGELISPVHRPQKIHDDTEVCEPAFVKQGAMRQLVVRERRRGLNVRSQTRQKIQKGDLVFSTLHTQNGLFGLAEEDMLGTDTWLVTTIRTEKVDGDYLLAALGLMIPKLSMVDTTGREQYKKEQILSLPIPMPNKIIQEEIGAARREAIAAYADAAATLTHRCEGGIIVDMLGTGGA